MNTEEKTKALNNALKSYGFNEKYFTQSANKGRNVKFAIASKNELGGINTYTIFFTYEEFNSFLKGYWTALNKPLNN